MTWPLWPCTTGRHMTRCGVWRLTCMASKWCRPICRVRRWNRARTFWRLCGISMPLWPVTRTTSTIKSLSSALATTSSSTRSEFVMWLIHFGRMALESWIRQFRLHKRNSIDFGRWSIRINFLISPSLCWLIHWSTDRLIDWLLIRLIDWLMDWLSTNRLVDLWFSLYSELVCSLFIAEPSITLTNSYGKASTFSPNSCSMSTSSRAWSKTSNNSATWNKPTQWLVIPLKKRKNSTRESGVWASHRTVWPNWTNFDC